MSQDTRVFGVLKLPKVTGSNEKNRIYGSALGFNFAAKLPAKGWRTFRAGRVGRGRLHITKPEQEVTEVPARSPDGKFPIDNEEFLLCLPQGNSHIMKHFPSLS